jgi:hypothetical protein
MPGQIRREQGGQGHERDQHQTHDSQPMVEKLRRRQA